MVRILKLFFSNQLTIMGLFSQLSMEGGELFNKVAERSVPFTEQGV